MTSFQIIFGLFVTQEFKDFAQISKFQTLQNFGQKKKKKLHSSNGQTVDSLHEKADGRTDGRTDTVNIHGVTGYVLTYLLEKQGVKSNAKKGRRLEKGAVFAAQSRYKSWCFSLKGWWFLENSQVHAAECQSLWV